MRLIEDDPLHRRVFGEECREEHTVPTSDVDDGSEATEVVRVQQRPVGSTCQCLHRQIEDHTLLGPLGTVAPDIGSVDVLEGVLAGADGMLELRSEEHTSELQSLAY